MVETAKGNSIIQGSYLQACLLHETHCKGTRDM